MTALTIMLSGSCQTNKQAKDLAPSEASSITTEVEGFSPMAETGRNTIDLSLILGNAESISSWKVEIKNGKRVYKTFVAADSKAPMLLEWDGKDEHGDLSPEGTYSAKLSVYYVGTFADLTTESASFVLAFSPPSGKLVIVPIEPVMADNGFVVPVAITIDATSKFAPIESWSMEIIDPYGKIVYSYSDIWPGNMASWNGSTYGGVPLNGQAPYTAIATIRDRYGNKGSIASSIRIDSIAITESIKQDAFITPRTKGFSPNDDKAMDSIVFDLGYGKPLSVKSWKVDILKDGRSVRQYNGTTASLPSEVTWDGKEMDGSAAGQASYTAVLSIDFGSEYKTVSVTSRPIILATDAPLGAISLSEPLFSPIESNPTIDISFQATNAPAAMESWSMRIYDPEGNLFKSFEGEWPNTMVSWDGIGRSGYSVESAEDYTVTVQVRDEFGNSALVETILPVDILVEKTPTGYRILSSRIFFKSYTADYSTVATLYASQNVRRLDQLADKLAKFPGYTIKIVGHAVMIFWDNKAKGRVEQEEVLIPLSLARADAVATALVARGFDASMLVTEGVGAHDPLVPDSDLVNRWRNRRVAIYLDMNM